MARAKLVSAGDVTLNINGEKSVTVLAGGKLLGTLAEQGIYLSSACGGGGFVFFFFVIPLLLIIDYNTLPI